MIHLTKEQAEEIIKELCKIYGYEWNDDHIHAANCGKTAYSLIDLLQSKIDQMGLSKIH
jgi:hypothetical protein